MARRASAIVTPAHPHPHPSAYPLLLPLVILLFGIAGRPGWSATVTWTGKGDGRAWSQPANWDTGRLPGALDEVVIPRAFGSVEHTAGNTRIRRLTADGGLRLSGGSLTVTNGETRLGGTSLVLGDATLIGDGPLVRLTMTGTPVTWEGDVRVSDGAVFELSRVTRVGGRNPTWTASGKGSLIDARAVTNVTLPTSGWFPLNAEDGATILFSGLTSLRGPLRPTATDAGTIDLSGLAGRWTTDGFTYRGILTATGGGRILGRGLTELDLVDVELDDPDALTTSSWTAFTRGRLRIDGASPNLDRLANLDDTDLEATAGAVVRLPALRQIRGRNPNWSADGAETLIEAKALASVGLPTDGWFPVTAENAAHIDLGGLATLRGPLRPTAATEGTIDLGGLKGLWSSDGFVYPAILAVHSGGRLHAPGITDLEFATVEIDHAEGLATRQWKSFTQGRLVVSGAEPDLSLLARLDDTDLDLADGAVIRLPALKEIRGRNPNWTADGLGTLLEAKAVTGIALAANGWFPVTAENQARIDLGGLASIRGPLRPTATTGGVIDLGGLRGRWTTDGFIYEAILTAERGGRIVCPGIVEFDLATVDLDAKGQLETGQWTAFTRGTLKLAGAQPDLSRLANLDESHLVLENGALARLPALSVVRGRTPDWQARDPGTRIEAAAVAAVELARDGWFPITAANQAVIDLSGLVSAVGPLRPEATGGGLVDLRGLRGRWSSEEFVYSHTVSAGGGGKVLCGGILEFIRGQILLDAGGVIPTDQLVVLRDSSVIVDGLGALASFGRLQDQSETTFQTRNGGRIVFSGLPRILAHPVGGRPDPGESFEFKVSAEGDAPLRYQWLRNGQPLRGETDATLRLAAVSPVDAGAYSVVVSNPAGSVESDPALLGIVLPTLPFADLFAQRGRITTPTGVGTADNRNAGREPGEPRHAGKPGGHSVWITWRAPSSGHITFRTTGSTFDTLLAVYVAARDGTRVEIASDEDSGGFLNSLVRFNALEGTEYLIAVDGYAGATGTLVLSWDLDFRLAAFPSILQQPVSTLGIVGGPARFAVAADPPGVTFQWFFQGKALAGQTEPVLLLPAVSPTLAGAYAVAVSLPGGTSVVSRTVILEVADRPQTAAALSADKLADLFGEDEFGSTAGFPSGAPPGLALLSTRPASSAPPAVGLPGSQWTDNSDSTRSPDEPAVCDVVTTATRWFRLRFNLPGGVEQPVKITTTGSEIATLLAVFTNNAAPLMIACDRAEPPLITSAEVQIGARRNVDYLVLVDGLDGAQGRIKLNWDGEELAPPAVEIREGRFRVEMRVTPGTYDWQHGSALDTWLDLFRTNVASGVFQYHAPDAANAPAGFYRLKPAP